MAQGDGISLVGFVFIGYIDKDSPPTNIMIAGHSINK